MTDSLRIPNLLEPHKDELISSYVKRLSAYNGFTKITDFFRAITDDEQPYTNKDGLGLFGPLFQNISYKHQEHIIQECSLYPYQSLFMTPLEQARTVHVLFNAQVTREQQRKYHISNKIIRITNYCPECKAEDLDKYGYTYLRRSHQLPGVTLCYKHHTQLYKTTPSNLPVPNPKPWNFPSLDYYKTLEPFENFSADLLKITPQANQWLLQYTIINRLMKYFKFKGNVRKQGFTYKVSFKIFSSNTSYFQRNILFLIDAFRNAETLKDYMDRYQNIIANAKNITDIESNDIKYCYFNKFNYPSFLSEYQELLKNLETYYNTIPKFFSLAKEYDIFKPFRMTLLRMRHKTCGTAFYTTPTGFLYGYRCPKCYPFKQKEPSYD